MELPQYWQIGMPPHLEIRSTICCILFLLVTNSAMLSGLGINDFT